jgi:hypothetical protein
MPYIKAPGTSSNEQPNRLMAVQAKQKSWHNQDILCQHGMQ